MLIIIDLPLFVDPCVLLVSTGVAETAVGLFSFFILPVIYFVARIISLTIMVIDLRSLPSDAYTAAFLSQPHTASRIFQSHSMLGSILPKYVELCVRFSLYMLIATESLGK